MLSLRNRFGIPGVISVIALVFAMLGGAYAASNNSGGGKATASAKAKRGPKGPKGATGPAGPAGANGAAGKDGANGAAGSAGANGKSVVVNSYTGGECVGSEEGITVEVAGEAASKKYVCNGPEGSQGSTGNPWTAGGTLPANATETGSWDADSTEVVGAFGGENFSMISFSIPLAAGFGGTHALYIGEGGHEYDGNTGEPLTTAEEEADPNSAFYNCKGTPEAPAAKSGYLCVYATHEHNAIMVSQIGKSGHGFTLGADGVSTAGARFQIFEVGSNPNAFGTWAVTG